MGSLSEFHKIAPSFETGGRLIDASLRTIFKGPDLGRYELRQPFPDNDGPTLPADIRKLLGWSDEQARTAGAYPFRR